jgi:hypothetical protein
VRVSEEEVLDHLDDVVAHIVQCARLRAP